MNDLTYSIYYTPNADNINSDPVNYVCSDNKIHIRFRDFNQEQLIIGFERKLAYLFTYLMNYSYVPTLIGHYDNKTLINNFLRTNDVLTIKNCIRIQLNEPMLKGFKIKPNYKKSNCNSFGNVDADAFPLDTVDGVYTSGNLKTFLTKFKISLEEYLFNDSYVIVIRENKQIDFNRKFINKANKKLNKNLQTNLNVVELW